MPRQPRAAHAPPHQRARPRHAPQQRLPLALALARPGGSTVNGGTVDGAGQRAGQCVGAAVRVLEREA